MDLFLRCFGGFELLIWILPGVYDLWRFVRDFMDFSRILWRFLGDNVRVAWILWSLGENVDVAWIVSGVLAVLCFCCSSKGFTGWFFYRSLGVTWSPSSAKALGAWLRTQPLVQEAAMGRSSDTKSWRRMTNAFVRFGFL